MTKGEHFKRIWKPGLETYRDYFDAGWEASLEEIKEYVHALQKALFSTVAGERNKALQKVNILKNKWKEVTKN